MRIGTLANSPLASLAGVSAKIVLLSLDGEKLKPPFVMEFRRVAAGTLRRHARDSAAGSAGQLLAALKAAQRPSAV